MELRNGRAVVAQGFLKFQFKVLLFHDPNSKEEHWVSSISKKPAAAVSSTSPPPLPPQIEYMTIQTVARRKATAGTVTTHHIEIFCKNFRKIEFVLPTEAEAIMAHERLEQFGLPGRCRDRSLEEIH